MPELLPHDIPDFRFQERRMGACRGKQENSVNTTDINRDTLHVTERSNFKPCPFWSLSARKAGELMYLV